MVRDRFLCPYLSHLYRRQIILQLPLPGRMPRFRLWQASATFSRAGRFPRDSKKLSGVKTSHPRRGCPDAVRTGWVSLLYKPGSNSRIFNCRVYNEHFFYLPSPGIGIPLFFTCSSSHWSCSHSKWRILSFA